MKGVIAVSVLAMADMLSAQILTDESKTGFYMTGKAGVSITSPLEQRFVGGEETWVGKYKGGDKSDTVLGAGLAVEYDLYRRYDIPVRTEVEFYSRGDAESKYCLSYWESVGGVEFDDAQDKLDVNTLMLNAYYGFRDSSAFTPWISAGLDYIRVHHRTSYIYIGNSPADSEVYSASASRYENNLAWNLGVGVEHDVTQSFGLDLSYRYLDAGDFTLIYKGEDDTKYKSPVDIRSNGFMLSATYNF